MGTVQGNGCRVRRRVATSVSGTLLHVASGRQRRTVVRPRDWVCFYSGGGKTATVTLDACLSP